MFQVAKDRASQFLFNIRKEMDELAKKLEHVKNRKWEKIHEKGRKYNPDEQSDTNLRVSSTRTSLPTKHRRNNKRKLKGSKRNKKKKRRRQQIINRKKMEPKDLLREANIVELPDDMFHPLDNTSYNWQEQEKEVCSLGLKFVPTIRRHNLANKYKDFLQFGRRLRLAVLFHRLEKENVVNENQIIRIESEEIVYEEPWTKPSTFNPTAGQNEALESVLFELEKYLFDPKNSRKVNDNLTQLQRRALKRLSTWNVNPQCDRMFRIQDKGSRLVLE